MERVLSAKEFSRVLTGRKDLYTKEFRCCPTSLFAHQVLPTYSMRWVSSYVERTPLASFFQGDSLKERTTLCRIGLNGNNILFVLLDVTDIGPGNAGMRRN